MKSSSPKPVLVGAESVSTVVPDVVVVLEIEALVVAASEEVEVDVVALDVVGVVNTALKDVINNVDMLFVVVEGEKLEKRELGGEVDSVDTLYIVVEREKLEEVHELEDIVEVLLEKLKELVNEEEEL